MSNLQNCYHFKLDFKQADQHTGGKCLIHGAKCHKDNQLQSLKFPCKSPSREWKHGIKETEGNMFNTILKENVQRRKHPGSCAFAEPELPSYRKPNEWP